MPYRLVGLRFRPQGLRFRPEGLRFRPEGLRSSLLGLRFRHIRSAPQCFLLVFVRFPVKAYCSSIFLNKHTVDMPAPPIQYGVFDLFGPLAKFSKFFS